MAPTVNETYRAGEVFSAPPQKLQLMLIEGAIRLARMAEQHWQAGRASEANQALDQCLQIITELLSGLRPEKMPELVSRVAGVYMFIFRAFTAAKRSRDLAKLHEAVRVLEVERETWRQVCAALVVGDDPPASDERLSLEA